MHNSEFYDAPLRFSGFLFAPQELVDGFDTTCNRPDEKESMGKAPRQSVPSKLVDDDIGFHMWGQGRITWYVT